MADRQGKCLYSLKAFCRYLQGHLLSLSYSHDFSLMFLAISDLELELSINAIQMNTLSPSWCWLKGNYQPIIWHDLEYPLEDMGRLWSACITCAGNEFENCQSPTTVFLKTPLIWSITLDKPLILPYSNHFLLFTCRYYCQQEGLSKPEALCARGFYCNGSAKVPNPSYAECPIGHYCPEGSYIPTPCPRGSFANSKRNQNVSDCKPCSPGYYCDPNATIVQERECDPGFVCILGKYIVIWQGTLQIEAVEYQ